MMSAGTSGALNFPHDIIAISFTTTYYAKDAKQGGDKVDAPNAS